MTFGIVADRLFDEYLVGAMNHDAPLVTLTDHIASDSRVGRVATEMKMDGITTKDSLLAEVDDLNAIQVLL